MSNKKNKKLNEGIIPPKLPKKKSERGGEKRYKGFRPPHPPKPKPKPKPPKPPSNKEPK